MTMHNFQMNEKISLTKNLTQAAQGVSIAQVNQVDPSSSGPPSSVLTFSRGSLDTVSGFASLG